MKKWLVGLLALACVGATSLAETATYTVASKTEVTLSGTAPDGATAVYEQTGTNAGQATSGNTLKLTLKGYEGATITGLKLSMKSNSSKGAGSLAVTCGDAILAGIEDSKFNSENWYGAWSTEYVDITPAVTETSVDGDVVILISATENSLYCQSYTVEYTVGDPVFSVKFDKENWFTVAQGQPSSVTAIPQYGIEPYTFLWDSDTPELKGGTTATLEIPDTLAEGDYTVVCLVTEDNGEGDAINALIGFTVEAVPVITGDIYTLVENADDFEAGAEYLIVSYSKDKFTSALKNEANGSRIGVEEVEIAEDKTVTTGSDAIVWTIKAGEAEGQYVLFNEAKNVYAAGPSSEGNNAQLLSDGSDALAQWTLDFSGLPAVAIGSVAYPERQLTRNSTATYEYFATYKGSGTKPYLFKKSGATGLSVTFDKANGFTVDFGTADSITATAKNGAEPYEYAWTSDTPDLNGTGETLAIPATLAAGDYTVMVTVTDAESNVANKLIGFTVVAKYPITVSEGILNGSIAPDKGSAAEGEIVNVLVTPDPGFKFESLLVNDVQISETSFPMPAEAVELSATFVASQEVSYTKIGSADELAPGSYVITGAKAEGEEYAMMAQISDTSTAYILRRETALAPVDGVISTDDDSIVWELEQGTDGWTIHNEAVGFIGYVKGGNSAGAEAEATAKSSWTITSDEGVFSVDNVGTPERHLWYNNSSPRFACYTNPTLTTTYRALNFYKAGQATFSIKLDPASYFEVEVGEEASITATPKNAEGDVHYAWTVDGEPAGSDSAVLGLDTTAATEVIEVVCTATDGADTVATASVSYKVVLPAPKFEVGIAIGIPNGSVSANKDQAEAGEEVTLTAFPAEGYKLGTFLVDGEAIPGDTFKMPAHDVLVSAEFIEKPVVAGFRKITSLDELTDGEYVITGAKAASEEYAMMASVSTGKTAYIERREKAVEIEEDVVTDAEDSIIWTLEQGANGWTIHNDAVGYAGYVASGNSAGAETEASAKSTWTITASTNAGLFLVENVDKEGRYLLYNASQPRFACYTNLNSGKHLALYKGSSGPAAFTVTLDKADGFSVVEGTADSITATAKNGSGDYSYAWTGDLTGDAATLEIPATLAAGNYTVKVTATDNGADAQTAEKSISFSVVAKYQIACAIGIPNGSVSADKTEAVEGEVVTLTAYPDAGYKLEHFLVNDIAISANTFPMPAEDVLVSASFVEITGETYALVESADDFEEGAEYLIVAYSKDKFTSALKNEANGTRIGVEEVVIADDNTVTTDSDAIVWKIQAGAEEGQYVLFNEAKGVYAAGPNSEGNNAQLVSDDADALAQWTLDFTDVPAVAIGSVAYSERQLNRNSTVQYNYFATYKGSGTKPFLFKKAGPSAPKIVLSGGETTIELGESFDLNFELKNYDGDFEWVVDSREGGTIAQDGNYTWTPSETGEYTIKVVARNGELDIASTEVPLTVTEPGPQPGEPAVQITGPETGAVDEEVSCEVWAINMEDPVVFFEGEYEAPEGSSLATEDIVFENGVCTFTPDVAGVYWIEFTAYESDDLDNPVCSDRWTVTVSDEPGPGPQPGEFQITKMEFPKGSNTIVLTFEGEGTPVVLGTASLATPQEWQPVPDVVVSGTTATVPMGALNYIRIQ